MIIAPVYPHIEKPDDEPARLARVPRVRISQIVADYLARGWSPEEMCRRHPSAESAGHVPCWRRILSMARR
jgi:hypothetical protein